MSCIITVFIVLHCFIEKNLGCTISINDDISEPQPLILKPEGIYGYDAFHLPKEDDVIELAKSELVEIACPGGYIVLDEEPTGFSTKTAYCTQNGRFLINNENLPISGITCTRMPYHVARYTGNSCFSKYKEIEVGFYVRNRFLRHLLICFDENLQTTVYSEFNLTKTIGGYQSGFPRAKWIEGKFYDLEGFLMNELYSRSRQRNTINILLGLPSSSTKYISRTGSFFLARGHLTAKADLLFGSQQRLTFYFINAVPQWQTFNGYNWKNLEKDVRRFASKRNLDLVIFTGTYGITALPHAVTGEDVELFLFVSNVKKAVPVPRLIWKIVYEPITKAGAVFVGVNNPYVLNRSKDIICNDICDQYSWLTWRASNITLGYSYCCSVGDFRKVVTTSPNLDVVRLLK